MIVVLLLLVLMIGSCCKTKEINSIALCVPDYEKYTKAYINPFMGNFKPTNISPALKYIDKYNYRHPCCNPNNNYEIAYCRKNNLTQSLSNMDLFTFNFCTGESKMLASNCSGYLDWSSTNWILYTGAGSKLYKIKPNGDSSTLLTPNSTGYEGKWSPNGKMIAYGYRNLIDNNGNILGTFPRYEDYLFYNDSILIGREYNENPSVCKIFSQNINSNSREELLNIPLIGLATVYYIYKNILYFSCADGSFNSVPANFTFNLVTKEKKFLNYKNGAFYQSFANHSKDKVIMQLGLKDTFTGNPSILNYRSHIAIMNPDGSDVRQVLIPE